MSFFLLSYPLLDLQQDDSPFLLKNLYRKSYDVAILRNLFDGTFGQNY